MDISPRTAYRYYQLWKKGTRHLDLIYRMLSAARRSKKMPVEEFAKGIAEALQMPLAESAGRVGIFRPGKGPIFKIFRPPKWMPSWSRMISAGATMAFKEVSRVEIIERLRQWQAGRSIRGVARSSGVSRATVEKFVAAA